MSGLPEGWTTVSIGDLGYWRGGGTPSKSRPEYWTDGTVPWVSAKDMKRDNIAEVEDYITENAINESSTQLIDAQSVLVVTRSGILRHSLPVAVNVVPVAINQDLKALTPFAGFEPDFILRQLQADAQIILADCMKTGTTVESIHFERFKARDFRIAPLLEQRRIVAKADGLTARTSRASEELNRIPTLIARYKQRLLTLAFSGELTANWRKERNLNAATIKKIDDLAESLRYGTSQKCYSEPQGVAVLRIPNVSLGKVKLDDLKYAELPSKELEKLLLRVGDLLIVRSNGSADLVGRPAIVDEQAEGMAYAGYLIRIRPRVDVVVPKFLALMLEAPMTRGIFQASARSTNGIHNVNAKELAALPIPVFELEEQTEIVDRIESAFGWLDRMAADHAAAARLLPKLDTAILTKAFRGQLVPQDPDDEPATALIKRIRSAQAETQKYRERQPRKMKETSVMPRNLEEVLKEAVDWLPAQEAFRRCGVADGAETEAVEALYAELRMLDKAGRLHVQPVADSQGRKQYDQLKLKAA